MSSTIGSATLTVKVTESISLNGSEQGATNTMTISSVNEISKRIVSVPQSEVTLLNFSTAVANDTFVEGDVRYIRISNKDDANFVYLVFTNEYNNEFCVKLDYGQSFIYNADRNSGVIDTMLANQVALGFTESTGDTGDDDDIENITATNKIIPGLRYAHDATTVPAGTSVGSVTSESSPVNGYRVTAHTLVTRDATTGAESVSNTSGGADTDGTATYSAGFGDLTAITAEADSGVVDLEVFVASV
tara:strand:- start:18580 stop:19317 length:738 start_codon:yes stop_codon:yes gene_type:complete